MGGKAMQYFSGGAVCLLLLTNFSLFFPSFSSAQHNEEDQQGIARNRGAQYYLGQADELLIRVNIWGFVQKPGQYMVPKDTDLISLISFAGGPLEQAKMKSIKLIRAAAGPFTTGNGADYHGSNGHGNTNAPVLSRRNDGNGTNGHGLQDRQVIEVNVKKYLETGRQSLIPELMPGDTIVVSGSAIHFVGKVLDFASKFAVVAQIYFWVNVAK
jgi:hypothetical protein